MGCQGGDNVGMSPAYSIAREHLSKPSTYIGPVILASFFAGIIAVAAYDVKRNKERDQREHLALPVEIRKYDKNQNGILEHSELEKLTKEVEFKIKSR